MMRGPKPLMAYCKVTVPIETMEFMRPMAMPGQKDMCHQTDEFVSIDNLTLAYEIYCRAIYELL